MEAFGKDCEIDVLPVTITVPPSPTLNIKAVADQMKQKGIKVFDFGVGEMNPEVPLPPTFYNGIIQAMENKSTHYCPAAGDYSVRQAISEDLQTNFALNYLPEQIVICPGPKDSLFRALAAVMNPFSTRNKAIAFSPVYESFTAVPYMLTGVPSIVLPTDKEFIPDFEVLQAELEAKHEQIAVIIINSPNNPSGAVYSKEVLQKLANIISKYPKIAAVSDEVYRTIRYDDSFPTSIASFLPNQTILVGGISKEVSGTGLRIGFVAAPPKIAKAVETLLGHYTACVNLPVQKGYATFLKSDKDMKERKKIRDILKEKRDIVLSQFNTLPGLKDFQFKEPLGAFYFFPNIEKYLGRKTPEGQVIQTDEELSLYILEKGHVVLLPGSKFGKSGYLRMAFASSTSEMLIKGCEALSDVLAKLS